MKRKKLKKHGEKSPKLNIRFCSVLAVSLASVLILSSWVSEGKAPDEATLKETVTAPKSEVTITETADDTDSAEISEDSTSADDVVSEAIKETDTEEQETEEFTWNEEEYIKTMYLTENCNRRLIPSTESDSYGIVEKGEAVNVIAKTDVGFYKVEQGGYICADYLTEEAPKFTWNEQACDKTMYLTENCNRRIEPTTSAASAGIVKSGTAVKVVATTDVGFVKIEDGTYLSEEFVTDKAPATQTASTALVAATSSAPIDASSIQSLLNTAPLNPRSTGYAVLDQKIASVFSQIFTGNMDTYSKVKACYDYLILNTRYGSSTYSTAGFGSMVEGNDAYIAWSAMCCLENHVATCNKYSSAFIAMMRTLGFDARYVDGQCTAAGGGYTGHVWVEVYIGGTAYVFDPQVEDNLTSGSNIQYLRFCKTYSQVPGKYIR